jgi:hypothetical protein
VYFLSVPLILFGVAKGMPATDDFSKIINQIPLKYIDRKISEEIINMEIQGFDVKDFKDYFLKSAKDSTDEFINYSYKAIKKGK